jgi:hypothetical protein
MQEGIQLHELLQKIKALRETGLRTEHVAFSFMKRRVQLSYGPPWAHCLSGYQGRLLGGPLGLLGLCHTAHDGVGRKDYGGEVLR